MVARILTASIAFILISGELLWAVSPDQTNLGILIGENKINLKFINICVSNMAPILEEGNQTDKQPPNNTKAETGSATNSGTGPGGKEELYKKLNALPSYTSLKKANQLDFNGNMWYYQSNYSLSFKNLRGAQGEMKDLYQATHELYLQNSRVILEHASPLIVRSNDKIAQHLLRLGFRDLKSSEDHFTTAYNSAPYQFRYKLLLHSEGMKIARRARRFALLAMIASKTPAEDKPEYQFVNLDDIKATAEKEDISDYERIRNTLINYIDNDLLQRTIVPPGESKDRPVDILEVHDDNYSIITSGRVSFMDMSNDEIRTDDMVRKETLPPIPTKTGN
ncbi:AraC family transcriptional regulator [Leptospira gomenensis]|uniref:AraC family transcriptional regulator n=1 Tax=Leptospira gomenensis TaxID=2484974 RepID=A0A5F1Y8L2_9LEPT|nr:AraC family transcriptional regulator [Leptospira gomenensis]TGK31530.1 AraC family transcriptional regulator [Leptospira gomenensis]TGK44180.1 AraC family transcriptional regulator [Leptospira gomenensis]TGK46235.1 AraC family transcriptional regulator [Leptospira gomenensis]TGK54760.1 AraC family transcriptional regulator [Leptospira gomenensis]